MKKKPGQILIFGIVILATITILIAGLFGRLGGFLNFGYNQTAKEQAGHLAEAGIEKGLQQLNATAGTYTGEDKTQVGSIGSFSVSVTDKSPTVKVVKSTGFAKANDKAPIQQTVEVEVYLTNQNVAFSYAMQVGTGGMQMDNGSQVSGNVYSNKACPGDSIYGDNGTITGNAYAVCTIDSSIDVQGQSFINQPPSQMPEIDYEIWKNAAEQGGTTTCTPTCTLTAGNISSQKYEGNVIFANGSTYTLNGPVYVTGTVLFDNNSTLTLSDDFGTNSTVLISDNFVQVDNNAIIDPNSSGKGFVIIVSTLKDAPAVQIDNNGVNTMFYALDGNASMLNNSGVKALVAKFVHLHNNAIVTYDSGLATTTISAGPGGSWTPIQGTINPRGDKKKYNIYLAEYFDNDDFTDLKHTEETERIYHDWGTDQPREDIQNDNFSIRWTGNFYLNNETYRLNFNSNDLIETYFDGKIIVTDEGSAQMQSQVYTPTSAGEHQIIVDFREYVANAYVHFNFVRHASCYDMTADYYVDQSDADLVGLKIGEYFEPYDIDQTDGNIGLITQEDVDKVLTQEDQNCY